MIRFDKVTGALCALSFFVLTACATDSPTEVGGSLLPSGDVVTFEVLLPASAFLVYDTSFSGYAKPANNAWTVLAKKFENTLDANTLIRFSLPPKTISVRTTGTTVAVDSAPKFFAGQLVVKFDTTVSKGTKPVALRLFRTAEVWDESATWTNRVDSGSVHLPWTTPGGTRSASIDTATWAAGDSAVFRVDSATLALWSDSANLARGALITSETNETRLRVVATNLHVSAHSSLRADTVVAVDLVPTQRTFVFNPTLSTPYTGIRVGGLPAWRAILKLNKDFIGKTYPCSTGSTTCTVKLDSAHLSAAQVLLRPATPPPGFSLEDSTVIDARTLLPADVVPLERSGLGSHISYSGTLRPARFTTPVANDYVKFDITGMLRNMANAEVPAANQLPPYLTLVELPEGGTFGVMNFDSNPVLRIVLTSTVEKK